MVASARPKRKLAKAPVYTFEDDNSAESKLATEDEDTTLGAGQNDDSNNVKIKAADSESDDAQDDSGIWDPFRPDANLLMPAAKKRKVSRIPLKKKKKEEEFKPFRFLDLPPELRNRIYELALQNGGHGMSIILHKQAYGRITARTGIVYKIDYVSRGHYYHARRTISGGPVVPHPRTALVAALLRVNKQIYNEAIAMFYSQTFYFQNVRGLEEFLTGIGHRNRKLLQHIIITEWEQRSRKPYKARSAMTWLVDATDLRCLELACYLGDIRNVRDRMKQVYFACQKFIEAHAVVAGRKTAAADIIKLSDANFEKKGFYRPNGPGNKGPSDDSEDNKAEFLSCLKEQIDKC